MAINSKLILVLEFQSLSLCLASYSKYSRDKYLRVLINSIADKQQTKQSAEREGTGQSEMAKERKKFIQTTVVHVMYTHISRLFFYFKLL